MKKFTLRIANFGLEYLQKYIESAETVSDLTVQCSYADFKEFDSFNVADLLFFDAKAGQKNMEDAIANSAAYAEYILISDEENFKKLDKVFLNKFKDVWFITKDTDEAILKHRVSLFLKQMHTTFINELTHKQLLVLVNSVPDLIWCKDITGDHLNANNAFCKAANKTIDQILGRDDIYIWNLDVEELAKNKNECMNTDDLVIAEQKTFLFDEKVKFDNKMRQFKTYKSPVIGRNNETIATIGLARDVTDIWNTHEEFKTLISSLPIPIIIVDDNYNFVSSNDSFENIFQYPQNFRENFDLNHFGKYLFQENVELKSLHETRILCSFKISELNESKKYFAIEKSIIYNAFNAISGYFYIFIDVTADQECQEHLARLAEIDELTQINNRKGLTRFFNENTASLINEKQSFSIIMLDVDFFKKYNDHYGHLEGDLIIKKLASIIKSVSTNNEFREDEICLARFGGEEFIVAIKNSNPETIKRFTSKIQKAIADASIEHKKSDISPYVTLSIGIAYYKTLTEQDTITTIMKHADDALYESKETGRNKYTLISYNDDITENQE